MPPVLHILRHGETVWNRAGRMQGGLDSPLTALGRVQAARQGAILRPMAPMPAACSPLGRARVTAALAGLAARPDPRLAEIGMGEWQGRSRTELGAPTGILWKFDAPGGEGLATFRARLDDLLTDLTAPAILVTHGVVSIALRATLMGLPPDRWDDLDDPQGVVHLVANGRDTVLR